MTASYSLAAGNGGTGNRPLTYDSRGNVSRLGGQIFSYNAMNRPTSMVGDVDAVYRYDGHGRRVRSVVWKDTGYVIRYNVYGASGDLIFNVQIDQSPTDEDFVSTYVKMDGKSFARVKSVGRPWNYTDTVTYLHNDHLGSASSGTLADGSVAWREEYTPFGITLQNDAANDNQPGFTGHIKDSATGLNYMQARYYDPVIGRFLSIDPMDFVGSGGNPGYFNRYAYTMNDPVNNTDPDGQACVPCVVWAVIYVADKAYGAYDAAQTAKGLANGDISPSEAAINQGASQLGGLIAGPIGRQIGKKTSKKIPNPNGKKGGEKHQQTTQNVVDDIEARGLISETELKIDTPDGDKNYRFVDAVARDPNTGEVIEMHQVGRTNPSRGDPVARERRAMDDIECATGCRPDFHDYNDPG